MNIRFFKGVMTRGPSLFPEMIIVNLLKVNVFGRCECVVDFFPY